MEELINGVKKRISNYSKDQIKFTKYCENKILERKIENDIIIDSIISNENLFYTEIQKIPLHDMIETRYKLIFKISTRYSLIVIVAFDEKVISVINVIKTSKYAEKEWRKKILK
jgi:hypothetical protein